MRSSSLRRVDRSVATGQSSKKYFASAVSQGTCASSVTVCVLLLWGMAFPLPLVAETPAANPTTAVDAAPMPSPQFLAMERLARQTSVIVLKDGAETTAELQAEPVMKYGDETRNIKESTLWIWMDGKLPVALQKIEVNAWNPDRPFWTFCIASLSDRPLRVSWQFRPEPFPFEPLKFHSLTEVAAASQEDRLVQLQMRSTMRDFSVVEGTGTRAQEIRLLPQPIKPFHDPDQGIRGGVFGFAVGTNPDVHVILRTAKEGSESPGWECAVARMTSAVVTVSYRGEEIYNGPSGKTGFRGTWGYFFTSTEFPRE